MFRPLRQSLARRLSFTATALAPRLPDGAARAAERVIRAAAPHLPVLAAMVEKNMRSAGFPARETARAYFAQMAHHFATALRIFRAADNPLAVARLAQSEIDVEPSITELATLLRGAGGLVIAPPHVCNYLLTLVRLNQVVPLSVYLRWSKDERRRAMKERWCRAAGLQVILEPPSAADPTSRAMACVESVREGRALVMTPDLAMKAEQGIGVSVLGRRVFLPSGPASIAMLAGVPLIPVFGRFKDGRHQIYAAESVRVPMLKRADGGRQVALQWATQRWADAFETFLLASPHAWFFWGDKHWTRAFSGDERYVQPLSAVPAACLDEDEPACASEAQLLRLRELRDGGATGLADEILRSGESLA